VTVAILREIFLELSISPIIPALHQNFCMLQYVIHAPRDGQVEKINYSVGDNVRKNAVIVKFVKEGEEHQEYQNTS